MEVTSMAFREKYSIIDIQVISEGTSLHFVNNNCYKDFFIHFQSKSSLISFVNNISWAYSRYRKDMGYDR
jgi:hypothetical protein